MVIGQKIRQFQSNNLKEGFEPHKLEKDSDIS